MTIAVTSQGPELSSPIDIRFDLARYYIVLDTDSGEFVAHDNSPNGGRVRALATQAAQRVIDMGVNIVVTCTIGPDAFATLQAGKVDVYIGAIGPVSNAIEQFKSGQLPCATKPNVEAHVM